MGEPTESQTSGAILEVRDAVKIYGKGPGRIEALRKVRLAVQTGSFVAVTGPSGSGKSTLLHAIAGLEPLTSGQLVIGGRDIAAMSDREVAAFRRRNIGIVFQFFNLLPTLNARENVALPLLLDGHLLGGVTDRADRLMDQLGLRGVAKKRPSQLSGGEMQRVAIARALMVEPRLVLADEPTGSLDSRNGEEVIELLRNVVDERARSVIVMTHDPRVAAAADYVIRMRDGEIEATQWNAS